MSKMDDLRAMREARYAAQTARTAKVRATRPATAPAPVAPPVAPPAGGATPARKATAPRATSKAAAAPTDAIEELCGHRAISGRTCTREQGHAAKSHRYS